MSRSPFDFQRGVTQWRIAPSNGQPYAGSEVFTLGYDGHVPYISDIAIGNYFQTQQTLTWTNVAVVRCHVNITQPETMPDWKDVSKDFQLITETVDSPGHKIIIAEGVTEASIGRTVNVSGCAIATNNKSYKIVGIKDSITAYVNKTVVTEGPRSSISAIMPGARWKFSLLVENGGAPIERAFVIQSARESGFYRQDMSMHVSKMSGTHTVYFRITLVDFDQTTNSEIVGSIPSARFWFKPEVGIQRSGSDVTGWLDQTSNHYDTVNANAGTNKPIYNASSVNGLPGITFAGQLNSSALHNTSLIYAQGDPRTVYAVVKPGGTSIFGIKGGGIFAFRRNFAAFLLQMITFSGPTQYGYSNGVATNVPFTTAIDYSHTPIIIKWAFDGINIRISVNGTPRVQVSTATGTEVGSSGFIIGNNIDDDGGQEFEGDINEILGFDGMLDDSEDVQVMSYLNTKFAVF